MEAIFLSGESEILTLTKKSEVLHMLRSLMRPVLEEKLLEAEINQQRKQWFTF